MAPTRDAAICLSHQDWSETSQLATLLTRGHGLVRGLAKGSRREKSAYSGGLETLTRGELGVILKAEGLDVLASWDLVDPATGFRDSLLAFRLGLYAADATRHLLIEHDPHPRAFDGLAGFLEDVGGRGAGEPRGPLLSYLLLLAEDTGHRPELEVDQRSGEPLETADVYAFSLESGGARAHDPGRASTDPSEVLMRSATLGLLRAVSRGGAGDADAETLRRALGFVDAWLGYRVGRRLPASSSLLEALGWAAK
ncbi:MAG: DNA repair protein RecO [Planctomycetota bacterium]